MTRARLRQGLAALVAAAGVATAAAAQDSGQAPSTPANPPPAGTLEAPPEQVEPNRPVGPSGSGETLSDRLEESRGVIQPPPGTDPGIVEEPPHPGQFPTPVIPPSAVPPPEPGAAEPR